MTPVPEVRAATSQDLSAVGQIAQAGWRNAYKGLIAPEAIDSMLSQWYSPEALNRRLAGGGLDVAVIGDTVAGYLQHGRLDATTHEVYGIYVRPDLLGRGAGWALWQRAQQAAALAGATAIELWVLDGNSLGINWYQRQGGAQVGERVIDMPDGRHTELRYRFRVEIAPEVR